MNGDDDLEDDDHDDVLTLALISLKGIMLIRAPGGERLPAVSYILHPNLQKGLLFAIGDRSRLFVVYRVFLSSVFYSSAAQYFLIRRLAAARHISPACITSAPRSDFNTKSLVSSIEVCRGF